MTPPDTNIKKQAKRHWGPLVGITFALLVAAAAFLWWMAESQPATTQDTTPTLAPAADPAVSDTLAPPVGEPVEPAPVAPESGNL